MGSTDDQVKPVRLLEMTVIVNTQEEPIDYPQVAGTILEPGEVVELARVPIKFDQSARTRYTFFVEITGETLDGQYQGCNGFSSLVCTIDPTIVDIPNKAEELGFNTLVAALTAADLVGLLSNPPNPGPFTVFAPSNEAFAKLGPELLGCLQQPKNYPVLREILLYHVANGKVLEEFGVTDGQSITMANGEDITFTFISDVVVINEKSAVEVKDDTDTATNGVIYGIDTVLVPPSWDVAEFLETCQATDPPVPAPTTPLTPAPQPEPTPSPTTKSRKGSKKGKAGPKKLAKRRS